jgi:predicted secreted protein
MRLVEAAAIYGFIWCCVFMASLAWSAGDRKDNNGSSTRFGVEAIPKFGAKLLWTTAIASLLFAVYYLPKVYSPITLKDFSAFVLTRIITPAAIYFIVWWVVLFAVLPWGVRSQEESGEIIPGTDPGAPAIPNLRSKLLWTTAVTTVVFVLGYAAYAYRIVTLDQLAAVLGVPM